jgi:predicted mannosyl-3-phosphoglycerate phosphatase (HAD superfamily)
MSSNVKVVKRLTMERMGATWSDEETLSLLTKIQRGKTIYEIALKHQRNDGEIRSKLYELAAQYYYYDNRRVDEIKTFTGLSTDQILRSIRMWSYRMKPVKREPTLSEIMDVLKDIQARLPPST